MLVERSSEVTLQQFVVVDSLGNHSSDKLEVAEMVGIDVRKVIDGVSNSVPGAGLEQGVVGVEYLPGDDDVPFTQQSTSILTLFTFEHDVEPILPFLC